MEVEQLIRLIQAVSGSELSEFEYGENGVCLHLSKEKEPVQKELLPSAKPTARKQEDEPRKEGTLVTSPLVGTFYTAPAEDAAPFVSVGDSVKKGQVLAIVEAMKLMNEIESECEGVVLEVMAENERPVEYGQPLFRIG
jgi:acetyl-CoA carboxylase biotin carboxyl carrier protein